MVGLSWGLWIDRLRDSWVNELDAWVQEQIGDSACRELDGQGRLHGVLA